MKFHGVIIAVFLNHEFVENRMLRIPPHIQKQGLSKEPRQDNKMTVISLNQNLIHKSKEKVVMTNESYNIGPENKCAILLLSNHQALSDPQQTLLRKYRYDKNGILIPSSIRYFMKRKAGGAVILLPLKYKMFSPIGGFLKYYKEMPPIIPYNSPR